MGNLEKIAKAGTILGVGTSSITGFVTGCANNQPFTAPANHGVDNNSNLDEDDKQAKSIDEMPFSKKNEKKVQPSYYSIDIRGATDSKENHSFDATFFMENDENARLRDLFLGFSGHSNHYSSSEFNYSAFVDSDLNVVDLNAVKFAVETLLKTANIDDMKNNYGLGATIKALGEDNEWNLSVGGDYEETMSESNGITTSQKTIDLKLIGAYKPSEKSSVSVNMNYYVFDIAVKSKTIDNQTQINKWSLLVAYDQKVNDKDSINTSLFLMPKDKKGLDWMLSFSALKQINDHLYGMIAFSGNQDKANLTVSLMNTNKFYEIMKDIENAEKTGDILEKEKAYRALERLDILNVGTNVGYNDITKITNIGIFATYTWNFIKNTQNNQNKGFYIKAIKLNGSVNTTFGGPYVHPHWGANAGIEFDLNKIKIDFDYRGTYENGQKPDHTFALGVKIPFK